MTHRFIPMALTFLFIPVALVCLALIDCGVLHAGPAKEVEENLFTCESHGFTIERPDKTWTFQEQANASDGSFLLLMQPAGNPGEVQIMVWAAPLGELKDGKSLRKAALKKIEGMDQVMNPKTMRFKVWDRKVPGLSYDSQSGGRTIRAHQCWLVEGEMQYILIYRAPSDDFRDRKETFRKCWDSFIVNEISQEMKEEKALLELAGLCGTEIAWARDWAEAAGRGQNEQRLILVRVHTLGGFNIADDLASGPFMDPVLVNLIQTRLVAFQYHKGMHAPFVSQEIYGLSGSTFGSSLLLVTPEGEVVATTGSLQTTHLQDFILEALARHPDLNGPASPGQRKGLELAAWHLDRGEYNQAQKILEKSAGAKAHLLKASLYRRLRKGEAALAEIEKARPLCKDQEIDDLCMEEALILIRMNRIEDAHERLDQALQDRPGFARKAEALYWIGACRLHMSGPEEAEAIWRQLIREHKDSRWAWKAAGGLKGTTFTVGLGERLHWPTEEMLEANRVPAPEKLDHRSKERAEEDGVAFLLRLQRADGSWINPPEINSPLDDEPGQFTQAVTAICGQALLPYCDRPEVAQAVTAAREFLLRALEKEKIKPPPDYFMDYVFWKRSYTLWFLADSILAGVASREELGPVMDELVDHLRRVQKKGGGWSYLVTMDLNASGEPPGLSMSFTTAVVLMSLLDTRASGVEVPQEMTEWALDCLEAARNTNHTYEYFVYHDRQDRPRNLAVPGAAGRGPLIDLAIHLGGRGSLGHIRKSLDMFMEHRHTYSKEQGKTLMHTGVHAQGSHYLMFDYAYAAEAIRQLPESERSRYRSPLLDQILSARTVEGSYVDNPLLGWHYGTGMALLAFQQLGENR